MLGFFTAAVAALFVAPLASATIVFTAPTGGGWYGNTSVTIAWTWNTSDPNFSLELGNPSIHEGLLDAGPIAVGNNIIPNTNSFTFELPVLFAGSGYFIQAVAVDNIDVVYAKSASFPILNNPTSSTLPPITSASTGGGVTVTKSKSAITSKSLTANSTSTNTALTTGTPTSTPSTSSPSSSFTQLIISSLSSATPSPTKSAAGKAVAGVNTGAVALAGLAGAVGAAAFGLAVAF